MFVMLILVGTVASVQGAASERTEINIPDILGYKTLKCDFHIHTVFSDGNVWPTIRVDEAWLQGLDAIAITDHLEYRPHKDDIKSDHNRSFEIAKSRAEERSLILIKGSEITRDMPPGHLNAIFLKDSNPLDVEDWRDAIRIANEQGALVFWNHPGWDRQAPGGIAVWYDEHTDILEQGFMMGIEVINHTSYYPEVHQWAIDKNLTILANSDSHYPMAFEFVPEKGEFRPYTLVFAEERSAESIKKALLDRRTAGVFQGKIYGDSRFLEAIFKESVTMKSSSVAVKGQGGVALQIHNSSDIDFQLVSGKSDGSLAVPEEINLRAGKTVLLGVTGTSDTMSGRKTVPITYEVETLLIGPGKCLPVTLELEVEFTLADQN